VDGKRCAEPVVHAELLEHDAHVTFDRVEADAEQLGDRVVGFAGGDPARDLRWRGDNSGLKWIKRSTGDIECTARSSA